MALPILGVPVAAAGEAAPNSFRTRFPPTATANGSSRHTVAGQAVPGSPRPVDAARAHLALETEECRRRIDTCDYVSGNPDPAPVRNLACSPAKGGWLCTFDFVRAQTLVERCRVRLVRTDVAGRGEWVVARERRGRVPKALAATCIN